MMAALLFFSAQTAGASQTSKYVEQGNAYYRNGEYVSSRASYEKALRKDENAPLVNFNLGTAYYKLGDYPKAAGHLQKSLLADDPGLRQKTHYNLGNARYKEGVMKAGQDRKFAIKTLEDSLRHYERAMDLDQQDADAKYNHDLVKRELDRLKKEEERKQEFPKYPLKMPGMGKNDKVPFSSAMNSAKSNPQPFGKGKEQMEDSLHDGESPDQESDPDGRQQDPQENKEQAAGDEQPRGAPEQQTSPDAEPYGASQKSGEDQAGDYQRAQAPPEQGTSAMTAPDEGQGGEYSRKHAERLVDHYQQNQEPRGLLNFVRGKGRKIPVLKDW